MSPDPRTPAGPGPLSGDLASSMRAEWRAEQEATTEDAAEQWRHGRTVRDLLVERMHRGEHVAMTVSAHRFTGELVEVVDDVASLRTVSGRVDVHLCESVPLVVRPAERVPAATGTPGAVGGDFRSRLLVREAAGEEATIGTVAEPEPLDGALVVGVDHVVVEGRGGGATIVPLAFVAFVMPRRE